MKTPRTIPRLVLGAILGTLVGGAVEARGFRPELMPNGWEFACSNCHVDPGGGGERTAFGEQVLALVTPGGMEEFWGPELAALDADGDGRTNGQELGDPAGTWRPGQPDPGEPADVTNPGVPDPIEGPIFLRADFNGDGGVDIADAVSTLNFLFTGGTPSGCEKAADSNGDGNLDITDAVSTLNFLFLGGTPPTAPFPACGSEDGEGSALGCETSSCAS